MSVTETTKPDPSGSSMVIKTITVLARDSKGRTRVENHFALSPNESGEGGIRGITISDPVAHTRTVLDPRSMHANVSSLADAEPAAGATPSADSEDLGVSAIEGLTVHGYRKEETEYWYSEQLHMNVKAKWTNSQGQTTTFTLAQVNLNEPEPTLFQVPPEYSIIDTRGAMRISGGVAEANLIKRVPAEYPALAKSARVRGSVEFTATIGTDGSIKNLQLVRGHPLLVNAAKEAVLQWRYRPVLLNGNAVMVIAPIIVNFTLAQQ